MNDSKNNSKFQITRKDFIFGVLSVLWRFPTMVKVGEKIRRLRPNMTRCVGKIIESNAKKYPHNKALLYKNQKYTHDEFNKQINKYANYFIRLGLKKGDVINIFLENRADLIFIIGAAAKTGIIASLINTKQKRKSLIHSLTINKVKGYIIGEELLDRFEEVKPNLNLLSSQYLLYLEDIGKKTPPNGYINLKENVKDEDDKNPLTVKDLKLRDNYVYIFTSGTTGLPKAVPISHYHTISASLAWSKFYMNITPDDIMYISLPFFHSNALNIGWAAALGGGATIAIARKFSASNFWDQIRKYKATCFNYVGEICRYLLNQPPDPNDKNHNVVKIVGNGLSPEIWKDFKIRFGIEKVYEFYGATEVSGSFANILNLDCTIGTNFDPYTVVKYDTDVRDFIYDENGYLQKVDEGEPGLVLFKILNPKTFEGYTNEKATKKKIIKNAFGNDDLWFNTGDMIKCIGNYHYQFVDRLGDTFRWKSENVSTYEVENIISSFEEIELAAVYGVNIPGTEGKAGMVSVLANKNHKDFDFEKFFAILKKNLPLYAIPIFLRFLTNFETTVSEKIRKVPLKKEAYNLENLEDPIYVKLPSRENYVLLNSEIYNKIKNRKYRF